MLRVLLPALLSACLGQASPEPAVSPATDPAAAAAPQPAVPSDCFARAAEIPGVDPADPRLQSPHLIVVRKAARRVQVFHAGVAAPGTGPNGRACYRTGLGFEPTGHKQREGDGRTPEGWYRTSDKPWSSFYAAIAVHYPNTEDANGGAEGGRITRTLRDQIIAADKAGKKTPQTTPLGGEILLHGGGSSSDWTLGCIALEDADIDDLRTQLPPSMAALVRILP